MSEVTYHKCDNCEKAMTPEETGHSTVLGLWNPDKQREMRSLFGRLYGGVEGTPQGEYDYFEFCSPACALAALQLQVMVSQGGPA